MKSVDEDSKWRLRAPFVFGDRDRPRPSIESR